MRQLLVVIPFLVPALAYGQESKIFRNSTMTYSELSRTLGQPRWDTVTFDGVTFRDDRPKVLWQDSVYGDFMMSPPISIGKVQFLQFVNCKFSTSLFLEGMRGGEISIEDSRGDDLLIHGFDVSGAWIEGADFKLIMVENSTFTDLIIDTEKLETVTGLYRATVRDGFLELTGNKIRVEKSSFTLAADEESSIENAGEVSPWTYISDSRFEMAGSSWFTFNQTNGLIHLLRNSFKGNVDLLGEGDRITWNVVENEFGGRVGIHLLAEIGPASYLNFSQVFAGKSFGWRFFDDNDHEVYFDGTGEQIADNRRYTTLLRLHKMFHDFYLQGGDIQTANGLYVRIKDLETRHLAHQYHQSPSFDLWIRLRLNNLLKFYTRYGTDPARASIISLWVIFGFGVFYLFFPSSWDLSSKSKLLRDFSNLRNVNSGRSKTFMKLLVSAMLALLNAFTLSLNSFVTLGFGEIPTKGIARYVTIAEGFLGWFLLTLFSVALISQSSF
jgi:hypothetical protein